MTLHLSPDDVPPQVTAAMAEGTKVTYGKVTLRPPSSPGARGASGQHRLEWTDPDTGKRRFAGATKLADAWRRCCETAEMLQRRKDRRAHRAPSAVSDRCRRGRTDPHLRRRRLRPAQRSCHGPS